MTYLELKALPDDQLAARGFMRNESGGLTRLPGTTKQAYEERKRTWGLASFAKAIVSKDATPALRYARLQVCEQCDAKDINGERLYRIIDGKAYCGIPRLSDVTKILRDEAKEGCGCFLPAKAAKLDSACPLKKWPEAESIEQPSIKVEQPQASTVRKPCGCGNTKTTETKQV